MLLEVDDPADPRVRLYCGLTDAALRRRTESEHGVFVVEGVRCVRALLASDWRAESVLVLPSRVEALADDLDAAAVAGVPVYVASRSVIDRLTGFAVHRGVLALAARRAEPDLDDLLGRAGPLLLVEGVNDHENMGALFRNAAAFGAAAVLLDSTSCDPLYRRSVRVSLGHVLRVPFARLEPWPAALDRVRAAGRPVVALDPGAADTIDGLLLGLDTAVMVGAEGAGLSDAARAAASHVARIPMADGTDSVNVATAAAIALHHLGCRR